MLGRLVTYLLTYGGAGAAILDPFVGLVAYVCLAILRPEFLWFWSVTPGNYSRTVMIATVVGWALKGFGNWRFERGAAPAWSFIAFYFWSVARAALAPDQAVAWAFVNGFSKIFLPVVIGFTIINNVKQIYILSWAITLSMGMVCLELNLTYLGGVNIVDGWGTMGRAVLATAMDMTAVIAFFLGLYERAWWRKATAFGSLLLQFHTILLSGSRGGMLGLLAAGAVIFWIIPRKPSYYFVLFVSLLVAARLTGPQLVQRYRTVAADREHRDASAQGRLDLWRDCADVMSKNLAVGVGPDHWPLVAPEYGWPPGKEAHQNWLQIGAEFGLPGLLMMGGFFALCLTRLASRIQFDGPPPGPFIASAARMIFAALVSYFVCTQFVTVKNLEPPFYITMLGVAILKIPPRGDDFGARVAPVEAGPPDNPRAS